MKTTNPLLTILAGGLVVGGALCPISAQSAESSGQTEGDAAAVQILLDRANFSPGSIDGLWGEGQSRTRRSLAAFQRARGLDGSGQLDEATSKALAEASAGAEIYKSYSISSGDTDGPFAESVSTDWKKMAQMKRLSYTSPMELLGEKFHASPEFLKKLNPGSGFKAGETIKVPNVEPFSIPTDDADDDIHKGEGNITNATVSEADKSITLKSGDKVVFYAPITPGSEKLPMPSGTYDVKAFDVNPVYYFDPDVIREAEVKEELKIPPGPNSPVGVVWIDLSKERYGIHGTPEPEKIGYTTSHGCIRMTNWDAMKAARFVSQGQAIQFVRN